MLTNINQEIKKLPNNDVEKPRIIWIMVAIVGVMHVLGIYGLYLVPKAKIATIVFTYVLILWTGLSLTTGSHRLFSHRSYKAKLPLQLFLAIGHAVANQNSIMVWASDHRIHHKYVATDADPYNMNRGFFFAHIGWLIYTRLKVVTLKKRSLDLSDLLNDPVVMFEKNRYHPQLVLFFSYFLPAFIPWYFWNESFMLAFLVASMARMLITMHIAMSGNSVLHSIGAKPYDKSINSTDNAWQYIWSMGEGWHNYHHVFPWDSQSPEFALPIFDVNTSFINLMAKIGFAYDLKTVPKAMVLKRMERTGDGSNSMFPVRRL